MEEGGGRCSLNEKNSFPCFKDLRKNGILFALNISQRGNGKK
jgi:hypothetical protein